MTFRPRLPASAIARASACLVLIIGAACNESDLTRPDGQDITSKRTSSTVVALRIAPDTATVETGASRAFRVVGLRRDGSSTPVTARWSSTGGTIDSNGVFRAGTSKGTFRIVATSKRLADTARVFVVASTAGEPTLVSLSLTPATAALTAGATQQFSVTGRMSDGSTATVTPAYTAEGGTITSAGLYTGGTAAGSFRVIAAAPSAGPADTSVVTITVPTPPPPATASCLDGRSATMTLAGTQTARLDNRTGLAANAVIDARQASWPQVDEYAVLIGGGDGWCWSGGRIEGFWDDQTSWSAMHGTAAFEDYGGANTIVEGLWLKNYGDGWKPRITADNWTLRRSHFIHMRDDCLENDYERAGLVDDVFFEGCYNAFSARPSSTNQGAYSGANNVWTIQNSLVWLEPMQAVYKGTPPNTSGFFKWDKSSYDSSPKLILRNNVFRADMVPADGNLCLTPVAPSNKVIESTNNTIVWLGSGSYPCLPLPPGWTLTTDRKVWDDAVATWKAAHPGL